MGLTIHWSLRSNTRSPKQARDMSARLRSRALDLPFEQAGDLVELTGSECDFESCGRDIPHRWLLIQAGQYVEQLAEGETYNYNVAPSHLIAFETRPGDGSEAADFGFCKYPDHIEVDDPESLGGRKKIRTNISGWRWSSFCKTPYASNPECGGVQNFLRCHLCVFSLLDHARSLGILEGVSDEGDFREARDVRTLVQEVGKWNNMVAGSAGQMKDWFGDDFVVAWPILGNQSHSSAAASRFQDVAAATRK